MLDVVYPAGKFPGTEKLKESLLGSSAVIVMVANVLTITLTSVGPTKIFGGKFSEKEVRIPGLHDIQFDIGTGYTEINLTLVFGYLLLLCLFSLFFFRFITFWDFISI